MRTAPECHRLGTGLLKASRRHDTTIKCASRRSYRDRRGSSVARTSRSTRQPFAGAPPALYYSAAAAILAGRKAGMTSFANRSRSSSWTSRWVPSGVEQTTSDAPGWGFSTAVGLLDDVGGGAGEEAAGLHRVLDAPQFRRGAEPWIAHRGDLLVGQRPHEAQLAEHLHVLLVVFGRLAHA